ncbi:MAG TPA: ATP-binding protein [Candidatus Acidoferrales bacterium]|nr:ATP-binding protein [Candidatus Acidoferrales bacterium]
MNGKPPKPKRLWLVVGGVMVALLAAAVFTLGSLRTPLHPERDLSFPIFFALSTIFFAALLVLSLVLFRNLLRVWGERRAGRMGSRFKVKMVAGAMGISLLPVVFLFFFSYSLVNRSLALWFPRPLEIANEQSQVLVTSFGETEFSRLSKLAATAAARAGAKTSVPPLGEASDAAWIANPQGKVTAALRFSGDSQAPAPPGQAIHPVFVRTIRSGADIWRAGDQLYMAGHAPIAGGTLYAARRLPGDFLDRYDEIESQLDTYAGQKQHLREYKRNLILALSLVTLLLVFTTTWVALFLSKQVTVPIQALAEATREISRGNFDHRIDLQARDELGMLVRSFNRMTEQLGEGRRRINEFTQSLEQAVEERERRRKLMETILENIPTGVVSLDASGNIMSVNSAVTQIFGDRARNARTFSDLLGEEAARAVLHLMRRSLRMGAASREIEVSVEGKFVSTAVTVSSLGPRRSNPGFIIVIDDLTDLLRAQRAAAWQEVAQRIAHEIKNPLTPIQLSAQRLMRHLGRADAGASTGQRMEFEKVVAECAGLIVREVQTLESLVDEFSQFARFPAARLAPADLNSIVSSALEFFQGRLDGVTVRTNLAASLPPVKADRELLRRVLVNLIDNAAEAMEGSSIRQLAISTRAESEDDAVVIEIGDSGHGISPEDKERLFLPHFSTKDRGTGLGLAIASRIVAEHNGSIRVEDNLPVGTKFVIRFPAAEVPAVPPAASPAV